MTASTSFSVLPCFVLLNSVTLLSNKELRPSLSVLSYVYMASQLCHAALSSTLLRLVLLALILSVKIECKTDSYYSPITDPNHHSFVLQSTNQQEQKQSGRGQLSIIATSATGEQTQQREVGKQAELPEVEVEFKPEVYRRRITMAAAAHPAAKAWPDLVGLDAEEAKKKILEEHPNMLVQIVPEGGMMTMDYNLRRVRIHKNKEQKVSQIPKQG
ncbi:unnamed protein product [Calypogeia fissa]